MKKTVLMAVALSVSSASYGQWLGADSPIINKINYLGLADVGDRIIAVGEQGSIVYSEDSGHRWRQAETPTSALLNAVCFADDLNGWAVGHDAVVLHTRDGGLTWEKQYEDLFSPASWDDYDDDDADMDDLYGDPYADVDDWDEDFDGGGDDILEFADAPLLDVHCHSRKRVIAMGGFGYYLETADGGQTWSKLTDKLSNPEASHLYSVVGFEDTDTLFIGGERGILFRSQDAGDNWGAINGPSTGTFFGLTPLVGDVLLAYGLQGQVWLTRDEGESWTELNSGITRGINDATVMADGTLVLVTNAGGIITNQGRGTTLTLNYLPDRQSLAAVLPNSEGDVVIAGQNGLRLVTLKK